MFFRFALMGICAMLIIASCRKSEAVAVEQEEVEMQDPARILEGYFEWDTTNCLAGIYREFDFELLWADDTARRAELLELADNPFVIGLLPDSNALLEHFSAYWQARSLDTIKGVPLVAEFTATHLLNYFLQRIESGHSDVASSACPDSMSTEMLKGIFTSANLKEGLKQYVSADLGERIAWIEMFYGAANMDYAPDPIPDFKKDSAASVKAVLAALKDYGLIGETPDSLLTVDTIRYSLRQFQRENGLEPDGVIGKRTRKALEKTNVERYGQLLANMERAREQLDWQKGEAYLEVNVPEFAVRFYIDGELIRQHKVIVGKRKEHKTPSFKASINEIVINPTWHVPYSISTKELLPKQLADSCYLDKHEYVVYDQYENVVDPISIEWSDLSIHYFPYDIVQQPGRINALGTIKFLFPNRYSVYLHDTPSKRLFDKEERDFSHGCIRVQDPYPLALDILEYVESKVDSVQFFTLLDTARIYSIPIYPKIPVIVNYGTVRESDNGEYLIFYHDLYRRDEEWVDIIKNLDL